MVEDRFEALAARDGVAVRATTHAVGADAFAKTREKIDAGLTWAVGAIVTDPDGRVLLVREDGRWLAPGGEVEADESHGEALVREVREETGVEIAPGPPVAVTEVAFTHGDDRVAFQFAHYTATPETTALAADPGLPGEGIEAVEWRESVPEDTVDREVVVGNQ
jgi:8-oxo-dGTP pyrophosphatase MutT (NUDIX family)